MLYYQGFAYDNELKDLSNMLTNTDNVFLSSPDIAVYEGIIKARLEFIDGTRLVVEILLQVTEDYKIYEERYYDFGKLKPDSIVAQLSKACPRTK
jgi:hypothetical protein